MKAKVTAKDGVLLVSIPMRFKRRSGRKEIFTPDGDSEEPQAPPQEALVSALSRAFKWREMMESRRFPSMSALARHLGIDRRYIGRLLELTLLAPDIIEAILAGNEPSGLSFEKLTGMEIPVLWEEQRKELGLP